MIKQQILQADKDYTELDNYLINSGIKSIFMVCGNSFKKLKLCKYFDSLQERLGIEVTYWSDFTPNPQYEQVCDGLDAFKASACDAIAAVGGGSAMDVAKCIKLFSNMDDSKNYLEQEIISNDIPFLAVPTTAGTGSEATRFAVIYYKGNKQSVHHISCIPQTILMDPGTLDSLPDYQRKATMLDALGHAMESFWSVNSNDESKEYAKNAIKLVLDNIDGYLANTPDGNSNMLKAAFVAGQAINITQTTAGHAMCYKITGTFGASHGHAVALVIRKLFPYMLDNLDKCIDSRGEEYLGKTFEELGNAMGCNNAAEATVLFDKLFDSLGLEIPQATEAEYEMLKNSVNIDRLKNNPIELDEKAIDYLYHQILEAD